MRKPYRHREPVDCAAKVDGKGARKPQQQRGLSGVIRVYIGPRRQGWISCECGDAVAICALGIVVFLM